MRYLMLLLSAFIIILMSGCSSLSNMPTNDASQWQSNLSHSSQIIIDQAYAQIGTPYRWGGTHPYQGLDCSGLTQYIYSQAGLKLPRVAHQQFKQATLVAAASPGDLLFFGLGKHVTHVGIYIGQQKMIHAPGIGRKVKIASIKTSYWKSHLLGIGSLNALEQASQNYQANLH